MADPKKKTPPTCAGCKRHKREIRALQRTILRMSKDLMSQEATINGLRADFDKLEKLYKKLAAVP